VPVTAGGDHSISYPILKALGAGRPVGLVHIDAHIDCTDRIADGTLHHGGPFKNAVLDGVLDPKRTIHITIRARRHKVSPDGVAVEEQKRIAMGKARRSLYPEKHTIGIGLFGETYRAILRDRVWSDQCRA
jgi:arginase family enzyme